MAYRRTDKEARLEQAENILAYCARMRNISRILLIKAGYVTDRELGESIEYDTKEIRDLAVRVQKGTCRLIEELKAQGLI
jgi:hypothetical protein